MFKHQFVVLLLAVSSLALLPAQLVTAKQVPAPIKLIKVYKYQGSVQCQGGGVPLVQMRRQLVKAGVKVVASHCGVDGLMYPSVCGAADGKINVFTITRASLAKAQAKGFSLLKNLADAQLVQCKL